MTQETLTQRLTENSGIRQIHERLARMVRRPIPWVFSQTHPKALDYKAAAKTCRFVAQGKKNQKACQNRFLIALEQAAKTGMPVEYICPIQRYTVCLPLVRNGQTQGHLAVCHSEQAFPKSTLELAHVGLESALREEEQAQELKKLSETIQPRCVALSTIHTIHRLISSTLDLKELLPRVARLCCQVLRAQQCAIWLIERDKQELVPRAVIQLEKGKEWNVRASKIGVGLVGKVAETLKGHMTEQRMAAALVEEECIGVIMVQRVASGKPFTHLDNEILTTLAEQAVVAIRNAQMYETQERVTWGTIRSLSAILDGMDAYSPSGGATRTKILADVAVAVAQEMKLPLPARRSIEYAALLHDAGRLGIPDEILKKTSKLEPAEFAKIKEHPVRGATFLEPLEVLEPAVPIILYHHERYDGTGYPKGLKKEGIPLGARILGLANAFEAMICDRPYRKAMPLTDAANEIASHSGTQFDPKVVEAFTKLFKSGRLKELLSGGSNGSGG